MTGDDWKGEGLIRAKPRTGIEDLRVLGMNKGGSMVIRKKGVICSVPGCGKQISEFTKNGRCNKHRAARWGKET